MRVFARTLGGLYSTREKEAPEIAKNEQLPAPLMVETRLAPDARPLTAPALKSWPPVVAAISPPPPPHPARARKPNQPIKRERLRIRHYKLGMRQALSESSF